VLCHSNSLPPMTLGVDSAPCGCYGSGMAGRRRVPRRQQQEFLAAFGGLPEDDVQRLPGDDPADPRPKADWHIRVWPVEREGRVVVGALLITPAEDSGPPGAHDALEAAVGLILEAADVPRHGLRVSDLRGVSWDHLIEGRRRQHEAWLRTGRSLFSDDAAERLAETDRGRGRRADRQTLADVAEAWLLALDAPGRAGPRQAVVEDLKQRGSRWGWVNSIWVRDQVRLARVHGFLTRTGEPGLAGDVAGPELKRWRQEQQRNKGGRRKR